jgi:LacI family transcriptional regulator
LRITLRDIARHTNVHIGTVSHVLNGSGGSTRVSAETRQRVLQAAAELGYSVNRAAQQLKTQRGYVVGLLVGALENPFFARMVSLCSQELEQRGYDMVLAVRRNDESNDLHLLQALVSRQVDGLLLWSETLTEVRERVKQPDMAHTVIMGYALPERDSVAGILHTGVQAALEHLVAQGRRHIGYLAPAASLNRQGDPRRDLYCDMAAQLGQQPRIYAYDGTAFDTAAPRVRAEQIGAETERPDALLCFNDMAAIGALMGFRRCGLHIPQDIALIGCDDMPLAAEMDVPLSSISYPLPDMCRVAVEMLLERIEHSLTSTEDLPARYHPLPTVLHVRESSLCTPH